MSLCHLEDTEEDKRKPLREATMKEAEITRSPRRKSPGDKRNFKEREEQLKEEARHRGKDSETVRELRDLRRKHEELVEACKKILDATETMWKRLW